MASKVVPIQPNGDSVRQQLNRMLESPEFSGSERMSCFLRFVVDQTLGGQKDTLKESVIGVHVFERAPSYDPKTDPVVRGEARRLRSKLLEYSVNHPEDPLWIDLPKGGYVPQFRWRLPSPPAVSPAIMPVVNRDRRYRRVIAAIAIVVAGLLLFAAARLLSDRAPAYSVLDARPLTSYPGLQSEPAFSPDGDKVAFSWGGPNGENPSIWIQAVNGGTPRQVSHSPSADNRPAWSPDGRQLAFVRKRSRTSVAIYTVDASGTGERLVAELVSTATTVGRVEWSRDGKYLLTAEQDTPQSAAALALIAVATLQKRGVTAPDPHITGDTDGTFSPDGRWIAFRRTVGPGVEDLYLAPAPGPEDPQPVPASRIRRLTFDNESISGHAWTADGRSIVVASKRGGGASGLWRFSLSGGKPVRLTQVGIVAVYPAISKGGHRLAYESVVNDSNIWELDLHSGGAARVVVASTMLDTSPQYSPDGTRITFRSTRSGSDEIWVSDASGLRARQITHFNGPLTGSPRWSPDGREVAFDSRNAGNAHVYIVPADGGTPRRFTTEPGNDVVPSWSHDDRFIYFASDRSGKWQVWRQPVAAGPAQQITFNGGFAAFESLDGQYVYYSKGSPDRGVWRVPVAGGPETLVVAAVAGPMWGNWSLGRNGIYFLQYRKLPSSVAAIQYFDFATGSTREVGGTTGLPMAWDAGLAVSSDERKLLYAQMDRTGSNLYVAEGFR